ncbi:MAG TPA: hypothetical protein VGM51_18895 [Armatimonadota bacterium]|jgi:hypothetical protein
MATQDDVRRICASLPGATEGQGRFGFSVEVKGRAKGFVWSWAERVQPRMARVPNDGVLAVLVPDLTTKEIILSLDSDAFFTEPHYNGFPAVLVRLEAIAPEELEGLLIDAWRCKAPPTLVRQYDEVRSIASSDP